MNYYPFYTPPVTGQIIQVNGRAGAEALQMSPNSSVYVQDSTQGDRIFLCMTDGAGYKTIRGIIGVFEEEQEKQQQESVLADLEERIKALEGKLDEYVRGHEPRQDRSTAKQHQGHAKSAGGGNADGNA